MRPRVGGDYTGALPFVDSVGGTSGLRRPASAEITPLAISRRPIPKMTRVTPKRSASPPASRIGMATAALTTVNMAPKIRPRNSGSVFSWRTVKAGMKRKTKCAPTDDAEDPRDPDQQRRPPPPCEQVGPHRQQHERDPRREQPAD